MQPTIVLHSALAPDALVDRLRSSVDEERRTPFSLSGYKGSRPVLGKVGESTFRLQKRRCWRNDFAPHFYGQIQPEPGGTKIEGYFDVPRWAKLFMRVWLAAAVALGTPIFVLTLLDVTTGSHNVSGDKWVGLAVPPALVAFGILLPKLGRLLGRPDERTILEHLQNTLAARCEDYRHC
jgi:hypothetical protein